MTDLCWQPLHRALSARASAGDRLLWIVSPFVKSGALERLLTDIEVAPGFTVIARWNAGDLVSGVSDLSVYELLTDRGCKLYANARVHLKLYVFESDIAFSTSGNVTDRGLGYCNPEQANVEVGSEVPLNAADWTELFRLIASSRQITPDVYDRFSRYVEQQPAPERHAVPDLFGPAKVFTLALLPATETPSLLADVYLAGDRTEYDAELLRRVYHDCGVFDIRSGLSRSEFDIALGNGFRQNAFVKDFIAFLRLHGSLRFGAVNDWIHQKCEDVPLPYRWEIKSNTRILYNWLEHYFPEITWSRPNYSQVILWREAAGEPGTE